MRTSDKFLVAVIVGLLLIAGAALFSRARQPQQLYQEEKTATAVASNYIMSFQEGDFERAYGYLSPELPGYPDDLQDFIRQVNTESYLFDRDQATSYRALSQEEGDDWAVVEVESSYFYRDGFFLNNRSTTSFTLSLELVEGEWKISGGDRFMAYCWTRTVCP
jgi:hypothetical protein